MKNVELTNSSNVEAELFSKISLFFIQIFRNQMSLRYRISNFSKSLMSSSPKKKR